MPKANTSIKLSAPAKIKSIQQAYLYSHMLRYHKKGAPIIEIQQSLQERRCPYLQLQAIARIHNYVWRLWEMGYVRSKSQYDDPYNPGLAYWIPTPSPKSKVRRKKNAKPKSTKQPLDCGPLRAIPGTIKGL
jgi:hypothetical protein